jgi:hypothetical protein
MSGFQRGRNADTAAHDRGREKGLIDTAPTSDHPTGDNPTSEQMAALGITRVPVDVFHFREFRYSNLGDAVEEATRHKLAEGARKAAQLPLAVR